MGPIALRNFQEIFGVEEIFSVIQSNPSFLLRRFVFRMVESSAKLDWLVMNRKGPWKGYSCLLPAFFLAHIFIKRERRLGTRQVVSSGLKLEKMFSGTKQTVLIKRVYVKRGLTVQCPNSGIFISSRSGFFDNRNVWLSKRSRTSKVCAAVPPDKAIKIFWGRCVRSLLVSCTTCCSCPG